jgi:glycosyltransferase involved in cell wall biosynthesis
MKAERVEMPGAQRLRERDVVGVSRWIDEERQVVKMVDNEAPDPPARPTPAPITVVIPAYQRESILEETVRSVLHQTLPVAEVVVVDDGSTDRTAEVAERLGVRVLRQNNQGVSEARNAGIRAATQEWVALLDSDDIWEAEKIEAQWQAIRMRPEVGLVFTDWLDFGDDGVTDTDVLASRPVYASLRRERLAPDVVFCDRDSLATGLFPGNFIKPSTIVARRAILLEAGLFDTGFGRPGSLVGQVEDRDFFLRLSALTDALVVERSLVRYRIHTGGASQDRLRMAMGAAEVAARVFAEPAKYPDGSVDFYRRDRPKRLREAGLLLMEMGRFSEARRVLWRSLHEAPAVRTLAALGVSVLGRATHQSLVRLKRKVGLPGLRSGTG